MNPQALDHQLRLRETALTTAEHRVELLRTRLENDASTTQKAAQAVEVERVELKVPGFASKAVLCTSHLPCTWHMLLMLMSLLHGPHRQILQRRLAASGRLLGGAYYYSRTLSFSPAWRTSACLTWMEVRMTKWEKWKVIGQFHVPLGAGHNEPMSHPLFGLKAKLAPVLSDCPCLILMQGFD